MIPNQNQAGDVKTVQSLRRDAAHEIRRKSVFWYIDHPSDEMLDRPRNPELLVQHAMQGGHSESATLAIVRGSLHTARRVLAAARRAYENSNQIADDMVVRIREELKPHVHGEMRAMFRHDVARARAEVDHWAEYVTHYGGDPSESHRAPEPDTRLPREHDDEPQGEITT